MNFVLKRENFFILCFLSLLLSLYFGENSSGGAYKDFLSTQKYLSVFQNEILNGFKVFIQEDRIHLPFFYLLKSKLLMVFSPLIISILYLIISSLIPLFFYKILKKKYIDIDKNYLFFLSMIIFLSPYFRSSAVWVTNDNIALLFFLISLFYFFCFKYENKKDLKYPLLSFLFLILSCYMRQSYFLFSLIYIYVFFKNLSFIKFFLLLFFNTLISLPALIYVYFFFSKEKTDTSYLSGAIQFDIIFSILIITSLFFFYAFPIIVNYFKNYNYYKYIIKKKWMIFLLLVSFLVLSIFYEIPIVEYGGGIFYKISSLINLNFLYFFSFLGLFLLIELNDHKVENYLIWVILILSFPFIFIYQKYFDPLMYILLFSLFQTKKIDNLILNKMISLKIIYFYYSIFLISLNLYYQ